MNRGVTRLRRIGKRLEELCSGFDASHHAATSDVIASHSRDAAYLTLQDKQNKKAWRGEIVPSNHGCIFDRIFLNLKSSYHDGGESLRIL
jgi:hypothetical protein